jgi:hypothetical protein
MFELSPSAHEIFRNYFQSKQPHNHDTLQVSSVVYLALTPRSRHVLQSVRKVCVGGGGGGDPVTHPEYLDLDRRRKN